MLNSLEYLLPPCGVYRMVIISVDRWTNCCNEIGKGIFFFCSFSFPFLTDQRLLAKPVVWEKKMNKSIGGVVYIDLHNPGSADKRAEILAWIPKIIGINCLLALLLLF